MFDPNSEKERAFHKAQELYSAFAFYMDRPEHIESMEFIKGHAPELYRFIESNNSAVIDAIARGVDDEFIGTLVIPLVYYRGKRAYDMFVAPGPLDIRHYAIKSYRDIVA